MAFTKKTTCTSAGENIVAQSVCRSIVVGEDEAVAGWPTTNWSWAAPGSTDYKGKTAGTKEEFNKGGRSFYQPGEIVAVITVPGASTTFVQAEQ